MKNVGRALAYAAILALPWQTRWFSDAALAGWPWEQGRIAVYASWFLMVAVILFSRSTSSRPGHSTSSRKLKSFAFLAVPIILSFIGAGFDSSSLKAVAQWWIQVLLIALFVRSALQLAIPARSLAVAFAASLMPHLGLAVWQQISQQVVGSKWLGMAAQLPATLGVSVIENNGERILRLYGGFPHPNIFGGWLAVALVASLWLAVTTTQRRFALVWSLYAAAVSAALILTFARSAWMAAALGLVALIVFLWKNRAISRRLIILVAAPSLIAVSLIGISHRDLIFSRLAPTTRLETKSLNSRAESLRDGLTLFRRQPFFGTGPNAELAALARLRGYENKLAPAPLESSHNVPLLALVNLGLIGSLLLAVWLIRSLSAYSLQPTAYFLAPLLIIAVFDHYAWSYWSGQALVGMVALIFLAQQKNRLADQAIEVDG